MGLHDHITVSLRRNSTMPLQSCFFPVMVPLCPLCLGAEQKIASPSVQILHSEDELPGYNFVSESFTYLCDKRNSHSKFFVFKKLTKNNSCAVLSQINRSAFGYTAEVANIRLNCLISVQLVVLTEQNDIIRNDQFLLNLRSLLTANKRSISAIRLSAFSFIS